MSDSDYDVRLNATGRNDPCPCGSGKKYKKCHLAEDEAARTAALKALEEEAAAKAEASKDAEGEAHAKSPDESPRAMKHQRDQPGSKGRAADGRPQNIQRRGAV